MDIGEIIEIGERKVAVPPLRRTMPSQPSAPAPKRERVKEPA